MRVSFKTLSSTVAGNLAASAEKLVNAQTQVTTGKRILRPSDDIAGTGKAMNLRSSISQIEQMLVSAESVKTSLSVSESAMNTMVQSMQQAYSFAVSMANSAVPDETRQTMSSRIDDIINTLITAGNTQFSGAYVFSGSMIDVEPISTDNVTGEITYNGDNAQVMVEVAPGAYIARNLPASAVFNIGSSSIAGAADIFTSLKQLKEDISSGNIENISAHMADIKANLDNMVALRSQLGTRINKIQTLKDSMNDSVTSFRQMLSDVEDIDLVDAVTKLNESTNVYQAALLAATKVLNLSLADYLS